MTKRISSATETERLLALLAALCMFLSLIEYLIPKPLPFIRLGLANLPILISLSFLSVRESFLLVLLKIFGQGLVNGTLFSYIFLFSLGGSLAAGFLMITAYHALKDYISLLGVSILGALGNNLIQILLARQIIFGKAALLMAPPFLIAGLLTSSLLGLFAIRFTESSEWVRRHQQSFRERTG